MREDFVVRFLLTPLLAAFCTCANINAQESTISLPRMLKATREYLTEDNLEMSRYYLTTAEKKPRASASARSGKDRAQEYYELWWVSAEKQRSRYLGPKVSFNEKIQRLRSPASLPRNNQNVSTPKISVQKALRILQAYVLEHSLGASTHYLHSASLVAAGRSARDIYWYVWLRDGKETERNDILLAVRMDGNVEQLHLT